MRNAWQQLYAPLIGRILIGGFFLWNGIQESLNLSVTIDSFVGAHITHASMWALIAVWIEILGGLALVVGFKTRFVALIMAVFVLLISTLLGKFVSDAEITFFLQNMAIVGGLFYISAFGSGSWE